MAIGGSVLKKRVTLCAPQNAGKICDIVLKSFTLYYDDSFQKDSTSIDISWVLRAVLTSHKKNYRYSKLAKKNFTAPRNANGNFWLYI